MSGKTNICDSHTKCLSPFDFPIGPIMYVVVSYWKIQLIITELSLNKELKLYGTYRKSVAHWFLTFILDYISFVLYIQMYIIKHFTFKCIKNNGENKLLILKHEAITYSHSWWWLKHWVPLTHWSYQAWLDFPGRYVMCLTAVSSLLS